MQIIIKDYNNFEINNDGIVVSNQLQKILENIKESPAKNSSGFKKAFRKALDVNGYPSEIKINPNQRITITTMKNNVGICLPLGNIARAFYDLMKLNYYSMIHSGFSAILICPINPNDNKAYFSRITEEIEDMYSKFIRFPIRIIGIDQ